MFPTNGLANHLPTRAIDDIVEMVSVQARRASNAVALASRGNTLTYGELESRANELVRELRSLGVGADVVVGICLQRSPAMVVAALAVLKAGGAYLPLDQGYPQARLAFQMTDANIAVLLTGDCLKDQMPRGTWQLVCLDPNGRMSVTGQSEELTTEAPVVISSDNLAYVIYTSGSTGQPKGVEVTRRSLFNLVRWHLETFGVTAADRASQLASPGFDAAVWEVWPYLTAGASLHFAEEDARTDPERLRDWMVQEKISVGFVPTPMAERMIQLSWPATTSLRTMLTGADTLHRYPPAGLPFRLINNYGPTECTVVTTSGEVPAGGAGLPLIGRPITNVHVHLLDDEMEEVADGSEGELYIGGAGVARGYRNREVLTAERFVADKRNQNGAKLYRTGDRVRRLPDGQLAFLGRMDDQVKIRGYRIEPAEVAAVLNSHPALQVSEVVARTNGSDEKQLVAYVAQRDGFAVSARELRDFLARQLPDFMIPELFVQVGSFVVNASGKIDRKALPLPIEANIMNDDAYVGPRTPLEERVVKMLAELLKVEQVGVNDNFFLLGGNSLLGAQVIARVRDSFSVELSLLKLFDHPTAAELAAEIEQLVLEKVSAISEGEAQRIIAEAEV